MRGGGEVDHGATPEGGTEGETTTGGAGVEGGGTGGGEGEGETGDEADHPQAETEVKGHRKETSNQKHHQCTSKLALM